MQEALLELGLDDREAAFYLEVLKGDGPSVAEVAHAVGVSRTSGYDIANRLRRRGMISATETSRDGRRARIELNATDPEYLLVESETRLRLLQQLVPELRALHSKTARAPRVRYLEGKAGVLSALTQTLSWPGPLRAILSMQDLYRNPGQDAMDDYVAKRIAVHLPLRVVRSAVHDFGSGWPTDESAFREVRYAPASYLFTMSVIIGDDAVVFISTESEAFALLVESKETAATQANLFEILWACSMHGAR